MRVNRTIYLTLLGVGIVGVASWFGLHCGEALSPSETSLAQHGTIGIGSLGRIEPRSRVIHVSHEGGLDGVRIAQVLVQEGQTVKAGEPVAIFSDRDRRQAEVSVAKSDIDALTARVAAADAEREDAKRDYERKAALSKTGSVSGVARDGAEMRLNKATAEAAAARAGVSQAEATRQLKELQLLQATVTAPIYGTVMHIYARAGERAGDNGILEMADLTALDVVAEVHEADIPRVKVGQSAVVKVAGMAASYAAKVREIGYLVRKNRVNDTDPLADRDARIIEVRLTLEGDALVDLRHQIYRQVQVKIVP